MANIAGRVKLKPPLQPTFGNLAGTSIPVFKIYFTIDGAGDYSVMVPREGFTMQLAMQAIENEASQIIDLMDALK